jgi:hypothetical protein
MTEALTPAFDAPDRFCPGCGYDLRGIGSERCPECGLTIDLTLAATSAIPWTHRRRIGVVRAYLKTIEIVIRWPERFAREVERPVDFRDAIVFRRVTATLAAVSVLALAVVLLIMGEIIPLVVARPLAFLPELLGVPVVCLGVWLAFLAAGGVQSYWFDSLSLPPAKRERAIALSYYACGPLALTPLLAVPLGLLITVTPAIDHGRLPWFIAHILLLPAALIAIVELITLWRAAVVMLRRTTQCGAARTVSCIVGLPLAWAVMAALFAVSLPGAYALLALMVLSF